MSGTALSLGLPLFILLLLLILVIPILMGVYVYRDAARRGMNAALWTLVALLSPGFIGLIIYLIVRSEHNDLRCKACSNPVKSSFAVCPYCGALLKEHCPNCSHILDPQWIKCPQCGEDIPEELRTGSYAAKKKDKGLRWILIAVLLIPLVLCVLMFVAMCGMMFNTSSGSSSTGIGMSSLETVDMPGYNSQPLCDWAEQCDKSGPGFYMLTSDEVRLYDNGEIISAFLLYCNVDGYYIDGVESSMGGYFTDATADFICLPSSDDNESVFYFYEYVSSEHCDARVQCDGKYTDVKTTEVDWSWFSGLSSYYYSDVVINACVDEDLKEVYSVSCEFFSNEVAITSEHALAADGSSSAGLDYYFSYPLDTDVITHAVVSVYDSGENLLFATGNIDLTEYPSWNVTIMRDDTGSINYKYHRN